MKKRILSLLMSLMMILSLMPVELFAAEGDTCVAKIGDTKYASLAEALNAAVSSKVDVTVEVINDINLSGIDWTPIELSTNKSVVTIKGNNHTITGLNNTLFGTAWASKGLIIKDLTIKNSNIVNDEFDSKGSVGVGAFVGYIDATETVTLTNCHVIDSTVKGGHWAGGLVGICGGYDKASDGTVFTTLTITGSSVEGCTVKSKGAAGAFIGHGAMSVATKVILDGSATENSISGGSAAKTGKLIGTIGAAGPVAFNGEVGGIELSVNESGNTGATNVAGRIGTSGGTMIVTGGSYTSDPLVTSDNDIGTIKVADGFVIKNNNGVYVVVTPDPVAKIGETQYTSLADAIAAAKSGDTVEMLLAGEYKLPNIPKNITITTECAGVVFDCVGSGSICSVPSGVTFENVTFNMGAKDYHGFQHAGTINMIGCTINGKFCSYGDMDFTECTFNAPGTDASGITSKDYSMWAYGNDITYTRCTFNCAGKCINVYCERNDVAYNIIAKDCTFYSTVANKAAFNVKETCRTNDGSINILKYNVSVNNCTANDAFPTVKEDGALLVISPLVQVDDRLADDSVESAITVTVDGQQAYPVVKLAPNTLGYQSSGNGYTALPGAPEVNGDVIHATPANAQYVLDGAYGSITGKTISFGAGNYDKLVFGRPTKYEGSETVYRHGSFDGDILSYEEFIAYKTQAGWTEYAYYERNISNVTFIAENDAVLAGMTFETGAHIYGTASAPVYDYVRDSGVWCKDTNNGYYLKVNVSNIVFDGIQFHANGGNTLEIATSQASSVIDDVTVKNCTFTGVGTTSTSGIAIRFYTGNQGEGVAPNVKNLTVEDTTIDNYYQGIYTNGAANTNVVHCTIKNTGHNAVVLQSNEYCNLDNTVVTDNRFENIGDRVIRIGKADAGSKFTITGNTAVNSGDSEGEMIKDAGAKADVTYVISGNNWDMSANKLNTVAANGVTLFKISADTYVTSSKVCVAQIDDIMYSSLEDAFAAAKSGETITLLTNCSGNGIKVPENSNFSVDFAGHTYTVDGTTVGSAGTETQAFQLLKDSTITFKNGTLKSTTAKMLIQNYANLTLNNMTLDGSELQGTGRYVLSNNNGNTVLKNGTVINAKTGDFAFDVCGFGTYAGAQVTVEDATITGKIELSSNENAHNLALKLNGSDFSNASIVMADGGDKVNVTKNENVEFNNIPADYKWDSNKLVARIYVAQINNTKYETLEEAFAAVKSGETIKLLADCSGNGIKVPENSNFTVDFAGHTYIVDGTTVGSAGTETQAFQLLKDSTITFKNGTLKSTTAKMLIQNYANLTLDNMKLDGSNLVGDAPYTLSTNNGSTVINDTEIIAKAGGVAFDVCSFGSYTNNSVTVKGNSVINGKIELSSYNDAPKTLSLSGGDFSDATLVMNDDLAKIDITKDDTVSIDAPNGYKWDSNGKLVAKDYVAAIGEAKYETLEDAFAAVKSGETIKLLDDCSGNGIVIPSGSNFTVDFANHTYIVDDTEANAVQLLEGSSITFQNGTLTTTAANTLIQNSADLTLEKMTLDGSNLVGDAPYTLSTNNGNTVIEDTTIIAKDGGYAFGGSNVTVEGESVIEGMIELDISGGTSQTSSLNGGDFSNATLIVSGDGENTGVTKADGVTIDAPNGYMWYDNQLITMIGDVDGDGDVDTDDLTLLVRHVAKISLLTEDGQIARADVYKDNVINAKDIAMLAQLIA